MGHTIARSGGTVVSIANSKMKLSEDPATDEEILDAVGCCRTAGCSWGCSREVGVLTVVRELMASSCRRR